MLCSGLRMSDVISTLGPVGTDSHAQAQQLGCAVSLHETFYSAIKHAKDHATKLLVPAGFREVHRKKIFSWVDFHFDNLDCFFLERVWFADTMPMVHLHRSYSTIAIHPSTSGLVPNIKKYKRVVYAKSKVEAYYLFARGLASASVTSINNVSAEDQERYCSAVYTPSMVWCLYRPKHSTGDD